MVHISHIIHEMSVVQMTSADDLGDLDVLWADQIATRENVQMNLIEKKNVI